MLVEISAKMHKVGVGTSVDTIISVMLCYGMTFAMSS